MRHSLGLVVLLGAGLGASACSPEGTYRLEWAFEDGAGGETSAALACGADGVDAVRVLGASTGGEGHDAIARCTDGVIAGSVAPGTWSFGIHALGLDGRYKEPLGSPPESTEILHAFRSGITIAEDVTTTVDRVVFRAQPACRDGVDNDRDGRVDLDDPECPDGEHTDEGTPPPPAP